MASYTSTTTLKFCSRKLLPPPVYHQTTHIVSPSAAPPPLPFPASPDAKLNANVIMVLLVLLCALICSLSLNSIFRFVFGHSGFPSYEDINSNNNNNNTAGANTGIKKKTLKRFPTVRYSAEDGIKMPSCLSEECAICLSEFVPGERVRLLPNCNHGFHVSCIDKWLNSHSSCPTCRHCLTDDTCQTRTVHRINTSAARMTRLPRPEREGMVRITV